MKKYALKITTTLLAIGLLSPTYGTTLFEVYQKAVSSDPTFRQAEAQLQFDHEDIPLARATLLPTLAVTGSGTLNRVHTSGDQQTIPSTQHNRAYNFTLTATQKLIDFRALFAYSQAKMTVKAAAATYAASVQDLMIRVATGYFAILRAQEGVRYALAQKRFLARNLDQAQQKYKVGLNTITDVSLAQANYSAAVAAHVSAENALENSREDLRAITGRTYSNLAQLKDDFQVVSPKPNNIQSWVNAAIKQNWSLQAAELSTKAAHEAVGVARSDHLPTVNVQASYDHTYLDNSSLGNRKANTPQVALNLSAPLFSGGSVLANTRQAVARYEVSDSNKEQVLRAVINNTRKNYLAVLANISKIKSDREAIKASKSALEGMEAGYKLGTQTMVDILRAQEDLFNNQTIYSSDRFDYLLKTLELKQSSGTLSVNDLKGMDAWLKAEPTTLKPTPQDQ